MTKIKFILKSGFGVTNAYKLDRSCQYVSSKNGVGSRYMHCISPSRPFLFKFPGDTFNMPDASVVNVTSGTAITNDDLKWKVTDRTGEHILSANAAYTVPSGEVSDDWGREISVNMMVRKTDTVEFRFPIKYDCRDNTTLYTYGNGLDVYLNGTKTIDHVDTYWQTCNTLTLVDNCYSIIYSGNVV